MRHYFFIETHGEDELSPQERSKMLLALTNILDPESCNKLRIATSGYKVNQPSGTAIVVTLGDIV